jgi:hypothetical protein
LPGGQRDAEGQVQRTRLGDAALQQCAVLRHAVVVERDFRASNPMLRLQVLIT